MDDDNSDNERGNPLPPLRGPLLISSKGSFICTQIGQYIPVLLLLQHYLKREIAPQIHKKGSILRSTAP